MSSLSKKYTQCISYFETHNPKPVSELNYTNNFELLVAVVLSAQCTDKRVNIITPNLFKKLPTAEAFANSSVDEIFELIKSCSYPRNKATHLYNTGNILVNNFNSEVPKTMEDLRKLPGVGQKTANVLLAILFDQPTIAVDTHVFRISNRIGLAKGKTPIEVETQLIKNTPKKYMHNMHHWLILHGRYVCIARKPKCAECGIQEYCDFYKLNSKGV